ncbi:MAG: metal-dependent hydrolase [Thermotaleaceae bacterium]
MMAKAHIKIGVLSYILVNTLPYFSKIPFIHGGRGEITVAAACAAGAAALMVDADSQHSKINQLNPITGTANKAIGSGEEFLRNILKMVFTIGTGITILYLREEIYSALYSIQQLRSYINWIIYGAAALFLLLGISGKNGERKLRNIPILGKAYKGVLSIINQGGNLLKRSLMVISYGGVSLWILRYNYYHSQDPMLYIIGGLFIAAVIFPHRSFFHSLEGLLVFGAAVTYLTRKIGYPQLNQAFIIGYFSHIYLADILTKEGVPLSSIPMIFEKIGLHKLFKRYVLYRTIHKILSTRLRLPIMSTGTTSGNVIEEAYSLSLLVLSVVSFMVFGAEIRLI